jgi:putative RNA 2'-phosphotransferase
MTPQLIRVSKFLAKYLRHEPEELGLTLMPGGWVSIAAVIEGARQKHFPVTLEEIKECVKLNDKKRFSLDSTQTLIRANQGHSTPVDLQLEEKEPPALLYHGTVNRFLAEIKTKGLLRMDRHHVHLSPDTDTAIKVGSRRGKPIILVVRSGDMHRDGYKFFQSENGVWLTDRVPPQYIQWESIRREG